MVALREKTVPMPNKGRLTNPYAPSCSLGRSASVSCLTIYGPSETLGYLTGSATAINIISMVRMKCISNMKPYTLLAYLLDTLGFVTTNDSIADSLLEF